MEVEAWQSGFRAGPGHAPTAQVVLDLLAHAVIPDR
jgi:hypothetical protein